MKFYICNKCKTFDHKYLVKTLLELYPNAQFDVKCQSYCGPGSKRPFLAIDEVFIEADTVDLLIAKVKEHLED